MNVTAVTGSTAWEFSHVLRVTWVPVPGAKVDLFQGPGSPLSRLYLGFKCHEWKLKIYFKYDSIA